MHQRGWIGEVAFEVGAESMAASQPHGVAATTSSSSICLQMESGSAPPPNLADLVDFLGLELIDSRVSLEKSHWSSFIKEVGLKKLHLK